MSDLINSASMTLLEKGLDAVWRRQQVISNNIANAATPGYKSKSLEFEEVLARQILKTGLTEEELIDALEKAEPALVENNNTIAREDGNNVNLDKENVELARSQMQYNYMVDSLNAQINRLKYVITEGRR